MSGSELLPDAAPRRGRRVAGLGWSAGYALVTRASALAAVPLILHDLGTDLYAAWVLAGTLVMAQGLADLGLATATVRYVAVGAGEGSRRSVTGSMRRSLAFYAALSAVVGGALAVSAEDLAGLVPYLRDDVADAAALVRYAAAAFAISNVVIVLAAVLQGLDRVDAAYRGQTLGWLAYVPALAAGITADLGVHAVGGAWVIAYAAQALLLAGPCRRSLRRLPPGGSEAPRWRQLLSLGTRWQVSAWADFATFQVPRLVGGFTLSSAALVDLDLALRVAQFVVAPFFVAYPLVLPAATAVWVREGASGVGSRLHAWLTPVLVMLAVTCAAALTLLVPAVATWSGQALSEVPFEVCAVVLAGVAAHASTGMSTSALLAADQVNAVVAYKAIQLVLACALVAVAAFLDLRALALAFGLSLALPAVWLHRRTARALPGEALALPSALRFAGGLAVAAAFPGAVALAAADAAPGVALVAGAAAAAPALLLGAALAGVHEVWPDQRAAWLVRLRDRRRR